MRTVLRNHADAIVAIDLCVVPTLTFESLFAFLVVGHGRRQLLWFAVTRYPTAEWLAQQVVQAFPWDTAPTYLVRDNDGAYGQAFTKIRMRRLHRAVCTVCRPATLCQFPTLAGFAAPPVLIRMLHGGIDHVRGLFKANPEAIAIAARQTFASELRLHFVRTASPRALATFSGKHGF